MVTTPKRFPLKLDSESVLYPKYQFAPDSDEAKCIIELFQNENQYLENIPNDKLAIVNKLASLDIVIKYYDLSYNVSGNYYMLSELGNHVHAYIKEYEFDYISSLIIPDLVSLMNIVEHLFHSGSMEELAYSIYRYLCFSKRLYPYLSIYNKYFSYQKQIEEAFDKLINSPDLAWIAFMFHIIRIIIDYFNKFEFKYNLPESFKLELTKTILQNR
jgi:hypothetical protein